MRKKVTIIDYGVGNLLSVQNAIEAVGGYSILTNDPLEICRSDALILPGVGAFGEAMRYLKKIEAIPSIRDCAEKGVPILGICLGMQILMDKSFELGIHDGLGLLKGIVIPIPKDSAKHKIKIPHVGWNSIIKTSEISWQNSVLEKFNTNTSFYFTHSFMVQLDNSDNKLAHCNYCGEEIVSVIAKNKIIGCQFLPEKSGTNGLKFIKEFINL